MQVRVQLEETTMAQLLGELLPITILLEEGEGVGGRWIRIDRARHLDFCVDEGIRLVTSGQLRWTVGPVPVTLTVHRLALMLRPVLVGTGAQCRLLFRPRLEDADLHNVPDLLGRSVLGLVNRALDVRSDRLAWDVGRTLVLRFLLPDTLIPLESAAVGVDAARLRVGGDAIELTIGLSMHISRETVHAAVAEVSRP